MVRRHKKAHRKFLRHEFQQLCLKYGAPESRKDSRPLSPLMVSFGLVEYPSLWATWLFR